MRKVITTQWLEANYACSRELDRHRQEFGERLPITYKNVYRLACGEYYLGWLLSHLISNAAFEEYLELRREFIAYGFPNKTDAAEAFWFVYNKYQEESNVTNDR